MSMDFIAYLMKEISSVCVTICIYFWFLGTG